MSVRVLSRYVALWLVLLGALALLRSHTFRAPILHDEAIFVYGGQAWAAGLLPYRDFWDHKPPHIFLFHSLPLRFFPFSLPAVRIHELLWLALAAVLFAAVCRHYVSRLSTALALLFFCFFVSTRITIRTGGLTEESSLAFVALSYWLILRPSPRVPRDALLAGLLLGIAAQFRQTYMPSVLFLALAGWRRSHQAGAGPKATGAAIVLCGLGFALPELFWSAYFALHGVWHEYVEASYLFNLLYIGAETETHAGFLDGLREHWRVLRDTGPILAAPALAAALAPWLPRPQRGLLGLLLVAFVCEFAPVTISGEYYHHYYVQATVSSCLLLALATEAIAQILQGIMGRPSEGQPRASAYWAAGAVVAVAVLAATAWLTVGGVRVYIDRYRALTQGDRTERELEAERTLGEAIASLTDPQDRILLLGVQPNTCYLVAKRYAGARYFHNAPLFKGKFAAHIKPAMQKRMMADLRERRPALIVLGLLEGDKEWYGMEMFDKRPAAAFLRPYLEENYIPLEEVVAKIPPNWSWYRQNRKECGFLVRKDMTEAVKQRLAAATQGVVRP